MHSAAVGHQVCEQFLFIMESSLQLGLGGGAGIGSGYGYSSGGTSRVENISIYNGTVTTSGSNGAGIGTGYVNSLVGRICISGGSFSIRDGTVGVGTQNIAAGPILTIGSPHIDCRSIGNKTCLRASSVIFDNGSFTTVTSASNLITASAVSFSGSPSIYVIYTGSSTQEQFTGLPIIHIPSITFPCHSSYEVTLDGDNFERTVLFDSRTGRGFGISVPSLGNYNLMYNSRDDLAYGSLTSDGLSPFSVTGNNDNMYTNVIIDEISGCRPPQTQTNNFSGTELFTPTDIFTSTFGHPRRIVFPTDIFTSTFVHTD
jgi:hypothetical protein